VTVITVPQRQNGIKPQGKTNNATHASNLR
jgi:hypothetical protein